MCKNVIYTHDIAMQILEEFEQVLMAYGISVPSPEDDERAEEDMTGLYGSTYSDLLDAVEGIVIDTIEKRDNHTKIVKYEFSGTV